MIKTILGIDPALSNLGYGIIRSQGNKISYIDSGTIKTSASESMHNRLYKLSSSIEQVILLNRPDVIAMEESFVNKNPSTSLKLGYARGALMALIGGMQIPYYEYKPNLIKKTVVGTGHADKEQVIHMMKIILSGSPEKLTSDEADALAVAYTNFVSN